MPLQGYTKAFKRDLVLMPDARISQPFLHVTTITRRPQKINSFRSHNDHHWANFTGRRYHQLLSASSPSPKPLILLAPIPVGMLQVHHNSLRFAP